MKIKHVVMALILGSISPITLAQSGQSNTDGSRKGHRGPPPEALQACAAAKSGDECSFTGKRGERVGLCVAPQGKPLACRPKNARGRKGMRPNK